ncbi:MAG TPA: tetratricopeptide repeat protein [Bacteroidetes bacterium]|nr:tetratricopeptide repeat protein [Bacteroidota bacterium]
MDKDSTYQLIERYFEGSLNEDELADFQKKLADEPDFASAFQLEKELMDGIENFGNQRLRKELDLIHQEEKNNAAQLSETGKRVPLIPRRYWLAAAVLLGIGVLASLIFDARHPTPQQLYAMYAVHDFDFTEKSGGGDLLSQAEALLKNKKYSAAIPILEKYIKSNPEDGPAKLAEGIAFLETGEYERAFAIFKEIGEVNSFLKNEAVWYTGLAYLKMGDAEKAKAAFSELNKGSKRYGEAVELMGYME